MISNNHYLKYFQLPLGKYLLPTTISSSTSRAVWLYRLSAYHKPKLNETLKVWPGYWSYSCHSKYLRQLSLSELCMINIMHSCSYPSNGRSAWKERNEGGFECFISVMVLVEVNYRRHTCTQCSSKVDGQACGFCGCCCFDNWQGHISKLCMSSN